MEDEHELARATGEGVPEGVIVRGVVVLGPDPRDVPIARMRDDATSVLASIDAGHINPARCLADCACHTLALIEVAEKQAAEIERHVAALKRAYRHVAMGDPDIASGEMGDEIAGVLAQSMGDAEFQAWLGRAAKEVYGDR